MKEQSQLNELAEQAYRAYAEHQEWTAHNGQALPQWDGVREDIQAAWEAAVLRVAELS